MQVLTFNFLYIGWSDAAGVRPWPPRMTPPSRVQDLVQFCVIGRAVSIHTGSTIAHPSMDSVSALK